ncbi:tRNA-His guanylyltransferase [Tulasnella sp. JGI-2019a]|nr:tRNA-His guanylyltransferase [Tulasnella sp. JGI-2019a]
MASSKFAYVKSYELPDPILPNTYFVVRIDGQSFHRFTEIHGFEKPNDLAALELMDEAAKAVMKAYPGEVVLAFGESDEYSFLFRRSCTLFNRRQSKILTSVVSTFTSAYVFNWPVFFPNKSLQSLPTFDGRVVLYPGGKDVRDYFAWRQADTHVNNLYNTTFWALIQQGGMSTAEAHKRLQGTYSNDKNEILHSQFNVNYAHLPERYRKGSVLIWKQVAPSDPESNDEPHSTSADDVSSSTATEIESDPTPMVEASPGGAGAVEDRITRKRLKKQQKKRDKELKREVKVDIAVLHCDIIDDAFWAKNDKILG